MANITYWNAVGAAWNRMKLILFQPFNMEKWFVMGFAAWIAGLSAGGGGSGGGSGGGGPNVPSSSGPNGCGSEFSDFWHSYGPIIILILLIVVAVIIAIAITLSWVHARGRFIFLDNLIYNRPAIVEPWKKYRKQGNSLFLWNLAIGAITLLGVGLCALVCIPLVLPMIRGGGSPAAGILGIGLAILLILIFSLIMGYLQLMVHDFVVPVMLKYDLRIREAWSRFNTILQPAFGHFLLYGLVIFLINSLISIAIFAAVIMSCCLLLLVLIIPYIGTVALLPAHVFRRWISIEFLRQFGENIDDIVPMPDPDPIPELPDTAAGPVV